MVKIAKASEFDFNKYLVQIQDGTGLQITSTNKKNHADFILSGQRWPIIFFWEIDRFIVEAKGSIDVYEEEGDMHLNYSCYSSGAFSKNGKILTIASLIIFFLIIFADKFIFDTFCVACYIILFVCLSIIPYYLQMYMINKYESMGIKRQTNRLRRILFKNTELINEIGHWLDN